jgi:hypothetical protein
VTASGAEVVIFRNRGPWRRYLLFQVLQSAPQILLLCWLNNPGVTGDKASCGATESCLILFSHVLVAYIPILK